MTNPEQSPIFQLSDHVVAFLAKSDPIFATSAGIPGYDALLPDYSVAARQAHDEELLNLLIAIDGTAVDSDVDAIAKQVLLERLSATHALSSSGELARTFSVIWSPLSDIRQIFELMANSSAEDAATIATRLSNVRGALKSWRSCLRDVAVAKELPSVRHLTGIANQAETYADGGFMDVARATAKHAIVDLEASGLAAGAQDAQAACAELAEWMRTELISRATATDAVGENRYLRWVDTWNGASPDLDELYAWGISDLVRIHDRMIELGRKLAPSATSLAQVADALDADPKRLIVGTDALLAKLKAFTAQTVIAMDGVHFDIDPRVRFCDARLAPEGGAAAPYYIGPSEDLSRPGTTWFPTLGATSFPWWRHASTWYHEAVPGHHLQHATAILLAERQTRFHRLAGWLSGWGEGWALYAERLMDELGAFTDEADELGYLANQALRAARVVVDIGLHLDKTIPQEIGVLEPFGDCTGKPWTAEFAVALLEQWTIQDHEMSVSEVDRYLGMPAQAISYKLGERVWLAARSEAKERLGERFSLKAFHAHALALGPLGLDHFAREMAKWEANA